MRLGQAVKQEARRDLHEQLVAIAQERKVIQSRKIRVDTSAVESNIYYPAQRAVE